ncbi:MAG: diaminopimelate epimerase [Candidatus Altiarchaeota archaeon]|nr:diaminopimelate epimerase [Candidatus Altiarchaeota archaeon]
MEVCFVKMHGAGNDFILVDEWNGSIVPAGRKPSFVSKFSDRHFGVGSDGVIFAQKSKIADANFVFYNPDGGRAEMCGNGIRCFAKFLYESGHVRKQSMRLETLAGVKEAELKVRNGVVAEVSVGMGAPQIKRMDAQVLGSPSGMMIGEFVPELGVSVTAVGMGNPHAVVFVDDVDSVDVRSVGSRIRRYKKLFPRGANAHFVQKTKENEFRIRTYERGVEDETLACGTGICASAVAAVLNKKADPKKPIILKALGGKLKVELEMEGGLITQVRLTGSAVEVFRGDIRS